MSKRVFTGLTTFAPTNNNYDDGFSAKITLPFNVNFFGINYDGLFVNINGNITFDGGVSTYVPYGLTGSTTHPIIAAFFQDVDLRGAGTITYGPCSVDGFDAFVVNWNDVGWYNTHGTPTNDFQLILINRATGNGFGDFDIEFNYNRVVWELSDSAGASSPPQVGYSNGSGNPGTNYALPGSGQQGAFVDGGPKALVTGSLNSNDTPGRYRFYVRGGEVTSTEPPIVLTGNPIGPHRIGLQWTDSVPYRFYNVYRSLVSGGPATLMNGTLLTNDQKYFTDTTCATNTTYFYTVKPVVNGTEGLASNELSVTSNTDVAIPTIHAEGILVNNVPQIIGGGS